MHNVNNYATHRCGGIAQTGKTPYLVHMPKLSPISAAEAAARAGQPKRTILWAIKHGHLKAAKLNGATGAYVIDPRDLDRYIENREEAAS